MRKIWSDEAWKQYTYLLISDRKTLKKVNELLKSIDRNGYSCLGSPEHLTGNLSSYYSLRIDKKNRLVFRIINSDIEIISCYNHYQDK